MSKGVVSVLRFFQSFIDCITRNPFFPIVGNFFAEISNDWKTRRLSLILTMCILALIATDLCADTWYVDASVGSSGDGTSWATAFETIQEGVDAASDLDTVLVTNGNYNKGGTVTPGYALTNRVCITKAITVQSMNGPDNTYIQGVIGSNGSNDLDSVRGVYMTNDCHLSGFRITKCSTMGTGDSTYDRSGAGILTFTTSRVSNCEITSNLADDDGGGVYAYYGISMFDCLVKGNVTINGMGGGTYLNRGGGMISNTVFSKNEAVTRMGGGLYNNRGWLSVVNCSFEQNGAALFGGGAVIDAVGWVYNCLFEENTSGAEGGGLYLRRGGEVYSSTFYGNSAATNGGGIRLECQDASYRGEVYNCIAWNNTAPSDPDIYSDNRTNIIEYTCAGNAVTNGVNGCTTNDPLFADAPAGDYQVSIHSPCYNHGNNAYAPTAFTPLDLAGNPRINVAVIDMGAYENPQRPSVIYVDASRPDDNGAGTNWATAKQILQSGVNDVVSTGLVWVTNGWYEAGGAATPGYGLTNRLCITNPITVRSVNGPAYTTIRGRKDYSSYSNGPTAIRAVYMENGGTLDGFAISNGYTHSSGSSRTEQAGGGIWMTTNCVVSNCLIESCGAGYYGGGVAMHYGGKLINCTVQRNNMPETGAGGGVSCYTEGLVVNCLIVENRAGYGGGAYSYGGDFYNCTISDNRAYTYGGGLRISHLGKVDNCIVWGNTSDDGTDISALYSEPQYTCASDGVTNGYNGCTTNNPQFVDRLGGDYYHVGDYRLAPYSPCINAGDNSYAPTNATSDDLLGHPRIAYGTVDMGAYEAPFVVSPDSGPLVGGNTVTITNSFALGNGSDITNVIIGSQSFTDIVSQTAREITFIVPAVIDAAEKQDITLQSTSQGNTTCNRAYTWNPQGEIVNFDWDNWEEVEGLPMARTRLAAGVLNGKIYACGGGATNVYCFDGTNWTETVGMPGSIYYHSISKYNDKLYSVGGTWGGPPITNVWAFDGASWTPVDGMPVQLTRVATATYKQKLYSFCGELVSASVSRYALEFNGTNWTQLVSAPDALKSLGAAVLNDRIYIFGGSDNSSPQWDCYNFNDYTWVTNDSHLPARCEAMAVGVLGDSIYAAGGTYYTVNQTNMYKFDGNTWSETVALPEARRYAGSAVFNERLYVIGGGGSSASTTNVFRYPADGGNAVVPASGPTGGGTAVEIMGYNLGNGSDITNVTINGISATINSQSATRVWVTTGAGSPSTGPVVVCSTTYGVTLETNAFAYTVSEADVYLLDLTQTYDGTAKSVTATTDPAGLTVEFTYDGNAWAPTNAGTYTVTGTVNDAVYEGSAVDTLTVNPASQTITFTPLPDQVVTNLVGLSASADSGLAVSFGVGSGPALIAGGTNLSFSARGTVGVVAYQPGNENYNPAPDITNAFRVYGICTVAVQSVYGTSTPPVGSYAYVEDTIITNSMTSPITEGTTQFVCAGWVSTACDPLSGASSEAVMTVTNSTTFTWQWSTNYWLDTEVDSNGIINVSDGWRPCGVTTQIYASGFLYYYFSEWTGDASGSANPLNLLMDGPKFVTAHFAASVTTNTGTPEWWLAAYGWTSNYEDAAIGDEDGDGIPTWGEYIADTVPTNPASLLKIEQIAPGSGNRQVQWIGGTAVVQYLEWNTGVGGGSWSIISTNTPPTAITNQLQVDESDTEGFYRIRAER